MPNYLVMVGRSWFVFDIPIVTDRLPLHRVQKITGTSKSEEMTRMEARLGDTGYQKYVQSHLSVLDQAEAFRLYRTYYQTLADWTAMACRYGSANVVSSYPSSRPAGYGPPIHTHNVVQPAFLTMPPADSATRPPKHWPPTFPATKREPSEESAGRGSNSTGSEDDDLPMRGIAATTNTRKERVVGDVEAISNLLILASPTNKKQKNRSNDDLDGNSHPNKRRRGL